MSSILPASWVLPICAPETLILTASIILSFLLSPVIPPGTAQTVNNSTETEWRTGNQLDDYLTKPVSASWVDAPIKDRILNFSKHQRVAIFLDRRIDPNTRLSISLRNITVVQFLWKVAEQHDWGVCRLDDFFYIGPKQTADTLPILWDQMHKELNQRKSKSRTDWLQRHVVSYPKISQPGRILDNLADENEFTITGIQLPHDLWQAVELPPTTLAGQVATLVTGFEKWFVVSADGSQIELIEFPTLKSGEANFRLPAESKRAVNKLKEEFSNCQFRTSGNSVSVSGSPADLASIRKSIAESVPVESVDDQSRRFTLNTKATRGSVLATIAQQTNRKLEFPPELKDVLNERIKIDVVQIGLNELIERVLEGTDAQYQLQDNLIKLKN